MFNDKQEFQKAFKKRIETLYGKRFKDSTLKEQYHTLGHMVREYISSCWIETNEAVRANNQKQLYYLSIEFLLGRLLGSYLQNLGIRDIVSEGLKELNIALEEVEEYEDDAALGTGGLGRLAACFLDSLASLNYPGHGCGIRYKHGLFEQRIVDGYQVEYPEQWLRHGYVWEVCRHDETVEVCFFGEVKTEMENGRLVFRHINGESVLAVPYEIPIVGYDTKTVNTLKLWNAEANIGPNIYRPNVIEYKRRTESITELLYPDDQHDEGKTLRLKQQYFLVCASLTNIINQFLQQDRDIRTLHEYIAVHINDTHPSLAVPELMRLLIDVYELDWDEAWHITTNTLSYTNHTILQEAMEKWPISIFKNLLPRIYMIVNEINERYCRELWERYPGDWTRIENMAIIAQGMVKMAPLAIVGSKSVNGVAELHTKILKEREMRLYYEDQPWKFNNKTNGITHRRWLMKANPQLSNLVTELIGDEWKKDTSQLVQLLQYVKDENVKEQLQRIKKNNKRRLAKFIYNRYGIAVDENSIFDVQIKRLHAYKRQLLNILHVICLYNQLKENKNNDAAPRTIIFGAKASPGYYVAKKIIKLINSVAQKVNHDAEIGDKLKVIFIQNYNVSAAEIIIPAANVSEQISTASMEASGTGNMKLMMNGALTLGTLDGANIEIIERVGEENFFLFGLRAEEVINYYQHGGYNSWEYYYASDPLQLAMKQIMNGYYDSTSYDYSPLYHSLLTENDPYFVLKDFNAYKDAQQRVNEAYKNQSHWTEMSLINIANSGFFSADRTIEEYVDDIWKLQKMKFVE